jgi:hypothetical protein
MSKARIQQLVGEARLDKALDELQNWANAQNDTELVNQVFLLKSQYKSIKSEELQGIVSGGEARIARARIANGILSMLPDEETGSNQIAANKTEGGAGKSTFIPDNNGVKSNIVLFLASNPSDSAKLQLDNEFRRVYSKLQTSNFKVISEFAATPKAMQTAILKYKPRIIHFSGHGLRGGAPTPILVNDSRGGMADDGDDGAGLLLEDENGKAKVLPTANLAQMFKTFDKFKIKIETVIFNACHSRIQAEAINEFVDYVVGYSNAISDKVAIEIADSFYENLTIEDNVELAFELTKNIVSIDGYKEEELMSLMTRTQ